MSSMNIQESCKNDLKVLQDQSDQVINDFCKLATSFLTKGTNIKLCQVASQKLGLSFAQVQSAVKALAFLFVEACQNELNSEEPFREVITDIGFKEVTAQLLYKEYLIIKPLLEKALPQTSVIYPEYSNLEWRFETQISSKSIRNEIIPRVLLKLELEKGNSTENVCIHSDIPNIMHMSQVLNQALQESRTNHSRKIYRAVN